MQVYHNAGTVIATHGDTQVIPAGTYGTAKRIVVPDGTALIETDGLPTLPVGDLAAMKTIALATISAWKRATQDGGFTYGGKTYDSDERSRLSISGAVQMAQIAIASSQPYEIAWTAADNAETTLDAAGIIALGIAAAQHVAAAHAAAVAHKAAIADAETVEDVIDVLEEIGAW